MVTRRVAKKMHKKATAELRAALGFPVPTEPPRTGVNLVPEGYVGWIRITTPRGRVKVRWVNRHGIVFRDSHCWAGGRFHIERHAVTCRVEPCDIVPISVGVLDPAEGMAFPPSQPHFPAAGAGTAIAHEALLSAGLPPHRLAVRRP